MIYLYLAAGGAAGTLARFWMSGWIGAGPAGAVPWGTLWVNVLGSLALGLTMGIAESGALSPELRLLVTVGIFGAFTTFSTMSYETVVLMQNGAWMRAAVYALGGLMLGIASVLAGLQVARAIAH